jgi:hypothetical protein
MMKETPLSPDVTDMKKKVVPALLILAVIFLLGFIPQYLKTERLQVALDKTETQLASLQSDLKMAELRDVSSMMLLEVLQQNYGLAKDHAQDYFEKLRGVAEDPQNASRKKALEDLLAKRDSVTASLAQGDPASASLIQDLVAQTYELTRAQ